MKHRLISGLGILMAFAGSDAALAVDPPAFAPAQGGPQVSVADVAIFPAGATVAGASILTRYNTYVDGTISTSGLTPNGAYSFWIVVFNNPEFCVGGCQGDDFPPDGLPAGTGDPRVRASVLWGGGFIANGAGAAQVEFHLDRGRAPGEVRFGPRLRRPRHADIHIVLRSHGPAVAGEAADQIGRFDGGCTPEEIAMAMCTNANVLFAAHVAP